MTDINDMSNLNTNLLRKNFNSSEKIEYNNRRKIRQGNISILYIINYLFIIKY